MQDQPEYDTGPWRELRNQKLVEWVGDENAVRFIINFSEACELFDDLIDQDKPLEDGHVVRVLWTLLTELPLNPFFDTYKFQLVPIIVTGINAWLDANEFEKGDEHEQSLAFVLRDVYMELIAFVIYLTRGRDYMREVSLEIRRFFMHNETLEEYRRKLA